MVSSRDWYSVQAIDGSATTRAILPRISCARGCRANFGNGGAHSEQADRRAAAAEIGIARKRPHQDVDREHRAEAVTDDHDFIQVAVARPRDQRLREVVEAGIDIGPAAVKIVVGEDPVVQ